MYTIEECVEEARKYSKKIDFRKNSPKYYRRAITINCLDKCHEHMIPAYNTYTEEDILAKARLCNTRIEFRTKYCGHYQAALARGLEEQCFKHMIELKHTWTVCEIRSEALKYSKRSDFMRNSGSAYSASIRLGILDDVCQHMPKLVEWWDREEIKEMAQSCSTVAEFAAKSHTAYATCIRRGWTDLLEHLTRDNIWSDEELIKLSKSFNYSWEFSRDMPWAYKLAKDRGLLGDIVVSNKPILMKDGTVRPPELWDIGKLREAAKACTTISEFSYKFSGARKFAEVNDLLWDRDIFSHFVRSNGKSIFEEYRTKDECAAEALKYTSRRRFYCCSQKYYTYAKNFGWLDEICSHMIRGKSGFNPEIMGYFYVLETEKFIGFGITNYLENRLSAHKNSFSQNGVSVTSYKVFEFASGSLALAMERHLKTSFRKRILNTGIDGFKRESVSVDYKQEFYIVVEQFLTEFPETYKIIIANTFQSALNN